LKYIIKRQISTGSFGTIYEVLSEDDDKVYALKELTNIDTITKQRFEREIEVLSQLDHPNIVKVIQWNIGGDPPNFYPYYVMEYLSGGSLRQHMDEKFYSDDQYYFDIKWTINRIILPVCNALAQAHSSNIYHRDLKPSNIKTKQYHVYRCYKIGDQDYRLGGLSRLMSLRVRKTMEVLHPLLLST
jgi:serine/threonine protein kinase